MNNLLTKISTTLATTTALSVAITFNAPQAEAVTFNLSWTGAVTGYSIKGVFSFDETQIVPSSIVTENTPGFNLDFSVFDPANNLLATYIANQTTYPDFNFNFDTSTNQVLQSQLFNSPNGFDLGVFPPLIANQDFNFYTSSGGTSIPEGTIRLCSGGFDCDAINPVGQGGIVDEGGVLVATPVPEPASILGLLAFGAFGAGSLLKKKQK